MNITTTNLQIYAKHAKQPEKMEGVELAFMRAQANMFLKSSDLTKQQVAMSWIKLLDHIDYMTLEANKR